MSQENLLVELGLYWVISIIVITLIDVYAVKKLGSKNHDTYPVVRGQKLLILMMVSGYTILLLLISRFSNISISPQVFTFLGIPYFALWLYFLITVLRLLKASAQNTPGTVTIRTPSKHKA